jgi:hypothetical protein
MSNVRCGLAAFCGGAVILASVAGAQPTNTTLPGGWSWQSIPGGVYDTGLQGTKRGGFNGQAVGPFNDTSFGVMDETGTPWFDGSDLSAQQYVQRQVFGNFGTGSPPGPAGARFYNFGYQGTTPGSNFPRTGAEQRSVSLNHWNNAFPDAGGVATFGQVVYVPVSATLTSGIGWGADEMLMKFIGGTSGQRSKFFVDATLNASFTSAAFGGINSTGNSIRVNAIVEANNAGPGNYDVAWGYGASNAAQVSLSRSGGIDAVFVEGQFVADPSQGIPANSVGYAFSKNYNVLSSLVQNGSSFSLTYDANADINNLVRDFGTADARASMGPGFEGTARLVVEWQAFRAIPTPGGVALAMGGLVLAARRRRA